MPHTPGEWNYGVRADGSLWLSLGNPRTGQHYQGDLVATEADAALIIGAPKLLNAAKNLRAAQQAYMLDRGNEAKGEHVGVCARYLDYAIKNAEEIS